MNAQISAVNMDAELGCREEITVSDGNNIAQATEFPPREPFLFSMKSRW